jgi:SAM-dependent methyltransferase
VPGDQRRRVAGDHGVVAVAGVVRADPALGRPHDTDVAPELMAIGERAAQDQGLSVTWQVADAQDLPFPDATFDVVLSAVGAMFAPDHERTARELLRVCRPGGTIAMANWTPDGEVGRFFAILARYAPPAPGPPPSAWGDPATVARLLAPAAVTTTRSRLRLAFTGPRTNSSPTTARTSRPCWRRSRASTTRRPRG